MNKHQVEFIDSNSPIAEVDEEEVGSKEKEQIFIKTNEDEQPEFMIVDDGATYERNHLETGAAEHGSIESEDSSLNREESKLEPGKKLSRNESMFVRDTNSIEVKLGSMASAKMDPINRTAVIENKMSKSIAVGKLTQGSIISPLKKQLERLT